MSSKTIKSFEYLFVDDCRPLAAEVCKRDNRKLLTQGLFLTVKCIQKMNATCKSIEESHLKSIHKFNEFICTRREEACNSLQEELRCNQTEECWEYEEYFSDLMTISEAFSHIRCSKDGTGKCSDLKKQLRVPTDAKQFVKWYLQEVPLFEFKSSLVQCRPLDYNYSIETHVLMPFCWAGDEGEKQVLKHWLINHGYEGTEKSMADYCHENSSIRSHENFRSMPFIGFEEGHRSATLRHELCDLKDPETIDFFYSKAVCYKHREKVLGKSIFPPNTASLPADKSKFVQWFCQINFTTEKGKKDFEAKMFPCGPYSEYECTFLQSKDPCQQLVLERQVACSRGNRMNFMLNPYNRVDLTAENFKCLAIVNRPLVNECYRKVGKLPPSEDAQEGDSRKEAICNSHEHFNLLVADVQSCLKSRGYPKEYIDACNDPGWPKGSYAEDLNCTFPIYGKAAEECFTKFTRRPLFATEEEFIQWTKEQRDSGMRFKLALACIERLKKKETQLAHSQYVADFRFSVMYEANKMCVCSSDHPSQQFHDMTNPSKRKIYTEFVRICLRESDPEKRSSEHFARFYCRTKNNSSECRTAISPLKSIKDTASFTNWFCNVSKDEYFKLYSCTDNYESDCVERTVKFELKRMSSCTDEKTGVITSFTNFFCHVKYGLISKEEKCASQIATAHSFDSAKTFEEWYCKVEPDEYETTSNECIAPPKDQEDFKSCIDTISEFELNKIPTCQEGKSPKEFISLYCTIEHGKRNNSPECVKAIPKIKSTNESDFVDQSWYCNMGAKRYLQLKKCVGPPENEKENSLYKSCLEETV